MTTRTTQTGRILFLLYVYGTLHYAPALLVVFSSNDLAAIVAIHGKSNSAVPRLIGSLVWFGGCALMYAKLTHENSGCIGLRSRFFGEMAWLLRILAVVWVAYIVASLLGETSSAAGWREIWLAFKGPVSSLATWITALLGSLALISDTEEDPVPWVSSLGPMLVGLVATVVAFSAAELWTGMAWSSESRGAFIASRASSTLFNPNVLGLWASFTIVAVACLQNEGMLTKRTTRILCILIAFVTLAAGSRSAFVLAIAALIILIFALGLKSPVQGRRVATTSLTWVAAVSVFWLGPYLLMFFGFNGNVTESLTRNGERLAGSFWMVAVYLMSGVFGSPGALGGLSHDGQLSLGGRFPKASDWASADNDFLAIAADERWGVLAVWLAIWLLALLRAILGFWRTRHRFFAYGVVLIVLSATAGLGMRTTQVFPISIFVAIALAWALFLTSQGESTLVMPAKD